MLRSSGGSRIAQERGTLGYPPILEFAPLVIDKSEKVSRNRESIQNRRISGIGDFDLVLPNDLIPSCVPPHETLVWPFLSEVSRTLEELDFIRIAIPAGRS